MALTLAAIIAALIAAAAAGTGAAHQASSNVESENRRTAFRNALSTGEWEDPGYNGWRVPESILDPAFGWTHMAGDDAELQRLKQAFETGQLPSASDGYFTEEDIDELLRDADRGDFNLFNPNTWGKAHGYDVDKMIRDYEEYKRIMEQLGDRPADIDYPGLADRANAAIDAENAQVLALYDQMLGRSNDLFSQEMAANNQAYNDYANQVLANNAMSTQAIAGSTRFEMDRARRNAIARGASAAQRLTANINAQLGLQNQAAQQQLATSNQLASALLQQRQAAAQLRGDYVSNLNADASRRAGLIQGTAERKSGLRNSYYNEAEARRSAEEEQWKNRLYGYLGDSPYATIEQRRQSRSNQPSSTYGL